MNLGKIVKKNFSYSGTYKLNKLLSLFLKPKPQWEWIIER